MKWLGFLLILSTTCFAAGPGGTDSTLDISSLATIRDVQGVKAAIPQPASTLPPTEAVGGAIGTAGSYRPADARQPRITRSRTVTLASDGTATFDWTTQGALSTPVQVAITPIYTGSGAPNCWATSATATSVSIKCVLAVPQNITLNALTVAATTGLNLFPYTGSMSGMSVGVIVLPTS